MNPFEVLQVSPNASQDEVREAYHSLAKKWHPDKFIGAEKQAAEAKFREIAEAYAAIKKGVEPGSQTQKSAASALPTQTSSKVEKTPADWLAAAKKALIDKQYDNAMALSQYCFHYPQVAEGARMVYAAAIEATSKDVKVHARAYEEVIHINPNNKEAIVRLADLYLELNMPMRAESMREKAKTLGIAIKSQPGVNESRSKVSSRASVQEPDGIVDKIVGFFKTGSKRG